MKAKKGRILVVDDEPAWREEVQEGLSRDGFDVETAASITEAQDHIRSSLYHLAVLDIRMNDADQSNADGMFLLRELGKKYKWEQADDPTVVLMLSAYGTKAQMREAFADYRVKDFLEKEDYEGQAFVQRVRGIFASMDINLQLGIYWEGYPDAEAAIQGVRVGNARVKSGSDLSVRMAWELEDLLCRLFHQAESIIVSPLRPGYSGAGVLRVQPFNRDTGKAQTVVVKFGDVQMIGTEYERYQRFVQGSIGQNRSARAEYYRRTTSLGGIVYTFLDTDVQALEAFGTYYRKAEPLQIRETLTHLLHDTCGPWYANRRRPHPLDLGKEYRLWLNLDEEQLEAIRLERLRSIQGKDHLTFTSLESEQTFSNPLLASAGRAFVRPVTICITHGDFNAENILVDGSGHTWLIDFLQTEVGHELRDVARLDTVVRTQLLAAEEATLQERLELEEALLRVDRFSHLDRLEKAFTSSNDALAKAYSTSLHLRRLASQLIGPFGSDDMTDFHIACLFYAMNTIRHYSLPKVQREHGLLSASLLADRLGLSGV